MSHRRILLTGIVLLFAAAAVPAQPPLPDSGGAGPRVPPFSKIADGPPARQKIVEEIVAIVNDEAITLSMFRKEYEDRVQEARSQLQGEELEKYITAMKASLLDEIITNVLLLQMAKTQNINVADQVKITVDNLKKTNNIDSDDDFKRALAAQGFEYDSWVKVLEERILRESVIISEVRRKTVIDDSEIVEYYKKHQTEFVVPEEYTLQAVYLSIEGKEPAALEAR